MNIEQFFTGLNVSANGMSAQRKRMNAIASNIANAETTRTEDGGPYVRKMVLMKEESQGTFSKLLNSGSFDLGVANKYNLGSMDQGVSGVAAEETTDSTPFKMVYDPSHPDANDEGYVEMPNVNVVNEMVDMISATRSYEANVTAISAAKQMAKDSLEI
ncbi:MAG: flagellar basal body rod protein FlgC [Bacteroidota bacterium]|jgi:flagellar basal-body rod protein FlgC